MNQSSEKLEVEVTFKHPHNIGIDIKGNFHRGLMIGFLIGAFFGILVKYV